jgi:hypothetical protein
MGGTADYKVSYFKSEDDWLREGAGSFTLIDIKGGEGQEGGISSFTLINIKG